MALVESETAMSNDDDWEAEAERNHQEGLELAEIQKRQEEICDLKLLELGCTLQDEWFMKSWSETFRTFTQANGKRSIATIKDEQLSLFIEQ